ncbi:hypothetical protein [Arthrobacter sp. SAFR-014]|uniref:hypothetical protein n=1 Tax=unclassified Arthrobacter TaxID=235627 RepID=UPI003F7C6EF2
MLIVFGCSVLQAGVANPKHLKSKETHAHHGNIDDLLQRNGSVLSADGDKIGSVGHV